MGETTIRLLEVKPLSSMGVNRTLLKLTLSVYATKKSICGLNYPSIISGLLSKRLPWRTGGGFEANTQQ
jgi:hypothetical protein